MKELILSVIVPSYDSEAYLEECLASIEHEAQSGVEFILVDGASSDGTMEIVEKYTHLFSQVISEKDRGQSDAFNKGFKLAKGKYLTWLNSDDVLCPGVMAPVLEKLSVSQQDWLTANSVYLDEGGHVTRCCRSGGFEGFAVKRGLLNVFGPSTFFSKKLFEELGDLGENYHYCMDTEYWWRIVASGRSYERINTYFWGLRLHSAAKTANVLLVNECPPAMVKERERIAAKYYPTVSPRVKRALVTLVKIWRILNTSYLWSAWDTYKFRGQGVLSIK
jgi:glycosyltransferase involved in cell wall biosynthesis